MRNARQFEPKTRDAVAFEIVDAIPANVVKNPSVAGTTRRGCRVAPQFIVALGWTLVSVRQ
jgi:hypothetical protein